MRVTSALLIAGLCGVLGSGLGCGYKAAKSPVATAKATVKEEQAEAPAQQAAGGKPAGAKDVPLARKIIYTAELQVIVEDFDKSVKELEKQVKSTKGYVAESDVSNTPGSPRTAHWRVRVPVAKYDAFRDAVAALGEVQKNSTDARDVTDEFYDLQARIKNKQKEEDRLNEILQKATGKLDDVLKIEEVLSRVRGEIEQMQGQAQRLTNLTSLTTVTVTLNERRSYVPPEAPGFGTSIGRTFSGSVDALVAVGRGLVLFVVALAPWLPFLAVAAGVLWLVLRRARRVPEARPAPPAAELPGPRP
jgi:hypothetical protein